MRTSTLAFASVGALLLFTHALGCSKEKARSAPDTSPPDDLGIAVPATGDIWRLAPAGTRVGVVASENTGRLLVSALTEIERSMNQHPVGKQLISEARREMQKEIPGDILDSAFHKAMGLDLSRPAAIFVIDDDVGVGILPVVDRDAFMKFAHGSRDPESGVDSVGSARCREVSGFYACANTVQLLDMVGKSSELADKVNGLDKHLRGHLEAYIDSSFMDEDDRTRFAEAFSDIGAMHMAVQFERGGFTGYWHLAARPTHPALQAAMNVPDTLSRKAASRHPAGFWRVRVPIKEIVPEEAMSGLGMAAAMVDLDPKADILDNLTGEMLMYSLALDGMGMVFEFGAKNGEKLQPLVEFACTTVETQLPPMAKGFVHIDKSGGRCKLKVDMDKLAPLLPPNMPFTGPIEAELYTEKDAIAVRFSAHARYRSSAVKPNRAGEELLTGPWNVSMWGYGAFTAMLDQNFVEQMKTAPGMQGDMLDKVMFGMWMLGHVAELGAGAGVRQDGVRAVVRFGSQWANPDDVLTRYQDLMKKQLDGEAGAGDELKKLARSNASTQLGRSYKAGAGGGPMVAASLLGVGAAVAIPAFMKYTRKARSSEAVQMLRKLQMGARQYAMDPPVNTGLEPAQPGFPTQSVGPTPPLGQCCSEGGKCAPRASYWAHPTWTQLAFSVDDPHVYSYEYEVDDTATAFTVRAIGDLDCDGTYSTFEMRGSMNEGGDVEVGELMRFNELE